MFKLNSPFSPAGDQPQAIDKLVAGLSVGRRHQVLLGVTGSGKTFSMANVIAKVNRPTLVISHNKTLAGQLYQEYRDFFPRNAVSYFVSYYDYYQPEAYIPRTDTYIEKETEVNDLIDKLRLAATTNLMTRKDVIVVASVSCIYNLGEPAEYEKNLVKINLGQALTRRQLIEGLVNLQYERKEMEFSRGSFRIRGDTVDIWPAYEDKAVRVRLVGDRVNRMEWIEPVSGEKIQNSEFRIQNLVIYPAKHYITDPSKYKTVFEEIRRDLRERVRELGENGRLIEAHRLEQKTSYDLEMIQEVGYVNGIENYSRYFDGRIPGEPPHTLLDYFKKCSADFLTIIDESHMSVPQIKGMYHGDQSRKQVLIDYGFRLPAAIDNRPLKLEEFLERTGQIVYTSATPDEWEINMAGGKWRVAGGTKQETGKATSHQPPATSYIVEQLIRPTGLVDPEIEVRPVENQVPDLVVEIMKRKARGERVLVTTLTKRTAEDLAEYLSDKKHISDIIFQISDFRFKNYHRTSRTAGSKSEILNLNSEMPSVTYLHSDIHTLDRQDILDKLRSGETDVLVGINLLREGLDLPEVSLVAILDADQEGFLRSKTSLIQTMGRAARHAEGKVILYAHRVTKSMKAAIEEVSRRRQIQVAYNLKYNIMPKTIVKPIRKKLVEREEEYPKSSSLPETLSKKYGAESLEKLDTKSLTGPDRKILIRHLRKLMLAAADKLDFETAAELRDKINGLIG
jgi:excinuclease ABC subunit B